MLTIANFLVTGPVDLTDRTLSGQYSRRSFFIHFDIQNQSVAPIYVIHTLRRFEFYPDLSKLALWYSDPPAVQTDQYAGYPNLVELQANATHAIESEIPVLYQTVVQDQSGNLNPVTYDLTQLSEIELSVRWANTVLASSDLDYPYTHILVEDILNWGSEQIQTFQQTVPN